MDRTKEDKPQSVRNFFIDAEIDGRAAPIIVGGPKRADGGFKLKIYMRRDGQVFRAMLITGELIEDDNLYLKAVTYQKDFCTVEGPR